METSEGTNHENSGSETLPESVESNLSVDLLDLLSNWLWGSSLVDNGNHGVRWVGNESAEDTGPVSRQEGNHELGGLAVRRLWLSEDVFVESLNGVLEGSELNHGVWDLSHPEWLKTSVENSVSILSAHLAVSSEERSWESAWLGSLHLDLDSLKWAQKAISDNLGAGGGDKETDSLVLVGLGTSNTSVNILEDFIESEFTESLSGVSDESWEPSEGKSLESVSSVDLAESVSSALVHSWVGLGSALDDIKWADNSVSKTAGEDTSHHALGVVRKIVNVAHFIWICFLRF